MGIADTRLLSQAEHACCFVASLSMPQPHEQGLHAKPTC